MHIHLIAAAAQHGGLSMGPRLIIGVIGSLLGGVAITAVTTRSPRRPVLTRNAEIESAE